MLNVLITVDTELWPRSREWPERPLPRPFTTIEDDFARDILGRTADGDYGLPYLLASLGQHRLKGVFFLESLHASAVGGKLLEDAVRIIRDAKQDIQLHVHTEWLSETTAPGLPRPYRQNLGDFDRADQTTIIQESLANLRAAGARDVVCLRAGNLGGSVDTPYAAKAAGLTWDMSFENARGLDVQRMIERMSPDEQAASACPTIPLSCVEDYPGHYRLTQLTAISFAELQHAMFCAERASLPYFVIMLHSFELVSRSHGRGRPPRPHRINTRRWAQLCDLLDKRRDVFRTVACEDLVAVSANGSGAHVARTLPMHTLWRIAEQIASRVR